jgi:hypothetical protein
MLVLPSAPEDKFALQSWNKYDRNTRLSRTKKKVMTNAVYIYLIR